MCVKLMIEKIFLLLRRSCHVILHVYLFIVPSHEDVSWAWSWPHSKYAKLSGEIAVHRLVPWNAYIKAKTAEVSMLFALSRRKGKNQVKDVLTNRAANHATAPVSHAVLSSFPLYYSCWLPNAFMIQTKSSATSKACKSSELHPGWRWTATLLSLRVSQQRKKKFRLQLKNSRERLQCWCHSYTCSVNQNRLLQSPSILDCQSSIFHKHYSHTNY